MSTLRILGVGADGTVLIDWGGGVVLNHYTPRQILENPDMSEAEALAAIELMRPPLADPVEVPGVLAGLVVGPDPVESERQWRDLAMLPLLNLRDRHRDEVELGIDTTLSAEQFAALLSYIQQLRDWPQSPEFPDSAARPLAPTWLEAAT